MNKLAIVNVSAALVATLPLFSHAAVTPANAEIIGLYPAKTFELGTGQCESCTLSRAAKWYFAKEAIAAPGNSKLPLVWLGSTQAMEGASISADGKSVMQSGSEMPFGIVPKLSTNLSYYNNDTTAFFSKRTVRLRGELVEAAGKPSFVARTIWPEDFTVKPSAAKPLTDGETLRSLVLAEGGGAKSNYATRVLWQRTPGQEWAGKSVIGLMLNGAQGDDDEAHGGHFGTVTGTYTNGSMHHWLVNNFYGINSVSEKGILAAVTPMDKYLMDLNNGQSYYRPSYMLVAVMRNDRIARDYQDDINQVFGRFYRHDIEYDHSKNNCAGLSSDGFRRLGWNIPQLGNSDQIKAIPAYAYVAATKGSLREGRKIYDYLTAESTRLYPAVAFDAMGNDLLALAQQKATRQLTDFEKQLASDVEAVIFVRIPQIPSSRAFGLSPVASFSEYQKQAPEDQSKWKIVPAGPRPFPESLRESPAVTDWESPVPMPVAVAMLALLGLLATPVYIVIRRRKNASLRQSRKGSQTEMGEMA